MSINPLFVPRPVSRDNWMWATVTQLSPLRIRFDGEAAAVDATPDSLIDPTLLAVGSRVWVQIYGNSMVVAGGAGGVAPPPLFTRTVHTLTNQACTGSTNNVLDGFIVVDLYESGDKIIDYNLTCSRINVNYGTIGVTDWISLGTGNWPAEARFTNTVDSSAYYGLGWIHDAGTQGQETHPLSVFLGDDGGLSLKGIVGLTTVMNIGSFFTVNRRVYVPAP